MRAKSELKFPGPGSGAVLSKAEQRRSKREPSVGVTAFVHRPDGSVLEGVVRDSSATGVKIAADPTGFNNGDALEVVVVVQGERVRFACEVKHVDPKAKCFGLVFRSGPLAAGAGGKVRRCMQCRRDFAMENNYCSHCGQKLVTR